MAKLLPIVGGAIALFGAGVGGSYVKNRVLHPFSQSVEVDPNTGDPQNAVKDFERLYLAIDSFRKKYKRLPKPEDLITTDELIGSVRLRAEDFQNPDYALSSRSKVQSSDTLYQYFMPIFVPTRPDGKARNAFAGRDCKELWLMSSFAAKRKYITHADNSREWVFSGSYVALFSDGSVERVKQKDVIHHPSQFAPNTCSVGFRGMGGVTTMHSLDKCPMNTKGKTKVTFVE